MKIQSFNNAYLNNLNIGLPNTSKSQKKHINYSNKHFSYISPGFRATNVELISKMEIALKENKSQELIKLFYQMSDKAKTNVTTFVKKFESNGLTLENYISACIKNPTLFYRLPETIENNVTNVVENLKKYGLNIENYIQKCIKYPSLFNITTETLENNVKKTVEKFNKNGLAMEDYLSACIKQPTLFYQSSETIENNVKKDEVEDTKDDKMEGVNKKYKELIDKNKKKIE